MGARIRIVSNRLPRLRGVGKRAATTALRASAPLVQGEIKGRTPVGETGNLRDSTEVVPVTGPELRAVSGGGDVDYAIYVHQGTRRMTAQPYLRNGFEFSAPIVADRLAQELAIQLESGS